MISVFFGLPGSGKTTLFAKLAIQGLKKFDNVYGNVHMSIPGYTYIDNDCIGKYQLENGLVLIDEATLYADSRDFKSFKGLTLQFWMEHRHYKLDICLFVQKWDALDIKIRNLTNAVFWVRSSAHLPVSRIIRIPFGIDFESQRLASMQKRGLLSRLFGGRTYGDIIMGYSKPSFFQRLFSGILIRPLYYKYFDSWQAPELPPLPDSYQPYQEIIETDIDQGKSDGEKRE